MTSKNAQCSNWCRFWINKISCKIGVLKQSQSGLFCSVSHMTILFVITCVMDVRDQMIIVCHRLWPSGSSPAHPSGFRGAPWAITFPPEADSLWSHFSTGPSASRNTFSVPTITDSYARTWWPQRLFTLPLHRPDCTLSRLVALINSRGVRLAGDPVDSDPGARLPWSPPWIGRWSHARALSVSPHSGADGLVQGELPPISPECWPFSPALPVTLARLLTAAETRLDVGKG